jgi:hypothetical protein
VTQLLLIDVHRRNALLLLRIHPDSLLANLDIALSSDSSLAPFLDTLLLLDGGERVDGSSGVVKPDGPSVSGDGGGGSGVQGREGGEGSEKKGESRRSESRFL